MQKNQISSPLICILMGTYNGDKFLQAQLDSIEAQTHLNWKVIISDDGSNDKTLEIVESYQKRLGNQKIVLRSGPKKGFCRNFLSLACDENIKADLYAFSDQDDVWYPNKLSKALESVTWSKLTSTPSFYCSRTEIVDHALNSLGFSPLFKRSPSFNNALVQSIGGGNTMVFNQATKILLEKTGIQDAVAHDWWLYQLVSGVNGIIHYDPSPTLKYRQHEKSIIGANLSIASQISRIAQGLNDRFKTWNTQNYLAIDNIKNILTSENQRLLSQFNDLRNNKSVWGRAKGFAKTGLYRQKRIDTVKLWLACILNKV